jgi:hypothetical protein
MIVCLSRYLSVHHKHPSIDHYIAGSNTRIKAEVKGGEILTAYIIWRMSLLEQL